MSEKVLENRLRRKLERMGYRLQKSRSRDERAIGYGGYMIIDKWTSFVEAGGHPYAYSLSLDDVENFSSEEKTNFPKEKGRRRKGVK